jgi:diacylglycerol kinase family enzyme
VLVYGDTRKKCYNSAVKNSFFLFYWPPQAAHTLKADGQINMEQITPKVRKAIVVHSPHSGRSAQLSQALTALHHCGIEIVDSYSIAVLSGLPAQGLQWRNNGIDLVVAAGGDGLVGGVIAHTITGNLPVGIIPLGTANDVARTVEIPLDPTLAAEVIAYGKIMEVDIGTAYSVQAETASISKQAFFAHALTVGLNVQFARLATDKNIRQQYGSMTYPFAVIEAVRSYKPIEVELVFEGLIVYPQLDSSPVTLEKSVTLRCLATQATVVNAPIFWGLLEATVPGVSLSDRLLDIVVVESATVDLLLSRIARFFNHQGQRPTHGAGWHAQYPALFSAELTDIPGIHHIKTHSVTITTPEGPQDVTLDGEVCRQTPISARVADERLRLIIPHKSQP